METILHGGDILLERRPLCDVLLRSPLPHSGMTCGHRGGWPERMVYSGLILLMQSVYSRF